MRPIWLPLSYTILLLCGCTLDLRTPTPIGATIPATPPIATVMPIGLPLGEDGQYIAVGERRLALYCTGTGSPTVILEAGLGADHHSWALVQPGVAALTRVCSYDRAGLGASDGVAVGRTGADVVADLAQLLAQSGESGPYILVGHSFGALFVRLYAAAHSEDVIGVVLVDAVHENWWDRAQALLPPPTAADSPRLQNFRAFMTNEYRIPAQTPEGIDIPATAAQVAGAGDLGKRPLLVLVAGIPTVVAPGLPADLETQLNALLQQTLPEQLLTLSSFSMRLPVDDSGHNIPQEQPDAVVVAIRTMLDVIRMSR